MTFEVELDDDEIKDLANPDEYSVAVLIRETLERRFMIVKVRGHKGGAVSMSESGMRLRRRGGLFGDMFG